MQGGAGVEEMPRPDQVMSGDVPKNQLAKSHSSRGLGGAQRPVGRTTRRSIRWGSSGV
jgi:hypothetical protein